MSNNYIDEILENISLYELFNIECGDLVLNINEEINEYSNSPYVNFYNRGDIGELINVIFNNINYKTSSSYLNNIHKHECNIIENEINMNEYIDDIE